MTDEAPARITLSLSHARETLTRASRVRDGLASLAHIGDFDGASLMRTLGGLDKLSERLRAEEAEWLAAGLPTPVGTLRFDLRYAEIGLAKVESPYRWQAEPAKTLRNVRIIESGGGYRDVAGTAMAVYDSGARFRFKLDRVTRIVPREDEA